MSHDQMFQMVQGVTADSRHVMTAQLSKEAVQQTRVLLQKMFVFFASKAFHVWTVLLNLTQKGKKTLHHLPKLD